MIIKSEAYKRAIKDYSRSFSSIFNIDGVDRDLHVKSLRINEIGIANDMLTIGGIYTNQLEMKILYPEKNAVTDTSIINIQGGIKVNGALDTTSLGWFYAYEVETNTNGNEMTVKAYDKSTLLKKTYIPNVSAPALLEDVVKDILGQCSIDLEETTVFPNYVVDTFVEGSTCLEMLGYCAGLMGRNGRMNRNNKFEFYWYHKPAVLDITRSGMQYMNGVSKGISLNYSALVSGTKDNVISSGSGKAVEFTNPLMTQEILDEVCAELLGSAGLTYTILDCEWRGDFAVQCGDTVRVEDKDGAMLTALVTEQEIYFCGGLKSKISSKGKSDTQTAMKSPTQTRLEKMESSLIESFKKIGETILGHRGGYYTVDVDENGNPCGWTIMNTPTLRDDTHLWRMTMGGLGYSEDGGRTFNDLAFDLNGNFSANVINTGVLKGNNFEINLNDGSIFMGPRDSRGEISDPVLSVSPSGELTLKAISNVEKEIQDIKLVPDVTIDTLYPTYQTYDKSAGIYIPDYSKQDQVLTPEVRVLGILKPLDPAKITWSKKNGELGQGETIVDGALHISRNLGEEEGNVAYVLDYEYASGQHKKVEVSIGLTVVGSDGTDGKDAAVCSIVASGTSFVSADGTTYSPEQIVLTPQFQGCGFDLWQYSTDGITWKDVKQGQWGFSLDANHVLTISRGTALLSGEQKCLNIKLLSSQLNVVSVVTITKIKDGLKGEKGDKGDTGPKGGDGTNGEDGESAKTVKLTADTTTFIATVTKELDEGGNVSYSQVVSPDTITLTANTQNCLFDVFTYSTDGLTWNSVVNGQHGFTINANQLTIAKTADLLSDNKSITFKASTSVPDVIDTLTITKQVDSSSLIDEIGEVRSITEQNTADIDIRINAIESKVTNEVIMKTELDDIKKDIINTTSSATKQTADEIRDEFNKTITVVQGDITEIQNVTAFIKRTADGIEVGNSNDDASTLYANDGVHLKYKGEDAAIVTKDQIDVDNAVHKKSVRVGNIITMALDDGSLIDVWVGD